MRARVRTFVEDDGHTNWIEASSDFDSQNGREVAHLTYAVLQFLENLMPTQVYAIVHAGDSVTVYYRG